MVRNQAARDLKRLATELPDGPEVLYDEELRQRSLAPRPEETANPEPEAVFAASRHGTVGYRLWTIMTVITFACIMFVALLARSHARTQMHVNDLIREEINSTARLAVKAMEAARGVSASPEQELTHE